MPVPFHTLKNGMQVKLGRIKPTTPPKAVRLENFWDRRRALRGLPEHIDYWTKAAASIRRMYLNNQLGCCVISGKMHQLGVYSANERGPERIILATDAEVKSQYEGICGRGDNGCYITAVLDTWRTKGLVANGKAYKLDGYASVNARNLVLLRTAIHIFGSVTFGIDLPASWLNTDDGELWDVTPSGSVGGHDVCAVGYDARGVVISTWGGVRTITWAALESGRYIDECYVQLSPDWYNDDGVAASGFDVAGLRKALEDFANGVMPDDPTPVPGPTPPPPGPTPPPAPHPLVTVTLPRLAFQSSGSLFHPAENQPLAITGQVNADGPIVIAWSGGSTMIGGSWWVLLLSLGAKYLPIILADIAAGKTWQEILADLFAARKKQVG